MVMVYAGVDAWMIQEGNLPELSVGECVRLGLMFQPRHVEPARRRARRMTPLGSCCYQVTGRVRFGAAEDWVIDVGWRLRGEGRPAGLIETLDWVQAEGVLAVDPWSLGRQPNGNDAAVATHYFTIRQIVRDTAFYHRLRLSENRPIEPGRSAQSLVEFLAAHDDERIAHTVPSTNARTDDLGAAHYVLALEAPLLTSEATIGGP